MHAIIPDHVRLFLLGQRRRPWLSRYQVTRDDRMTQLNALRTVLVCVIDLVVDIWKARTLVT